MNKILIVIIVVVIASFGVYKAVAAISNKEVKMTDKKVLVAYYSYSGNTKAVAKKIQSVIGGDLFEISPAKEYPKDYNTVVEQAKIEKQDDIRPELTDKGNVTDYDIIFVGTPVWWYTMASPVKTFLASNNFKGKIVVPFCTQGGGGESSTYTDMQKLVQNAKVLEGYTSYEDSANTEDIKKWINNLNF